MATATPIWDNTTKHKFYIYDEIYTGPTGNGQYVPKINDAIRRYWDDSTYTDYRVTAVNTDGTSTMAEVLPKLSQDATTVLNSYSESFVVYYDTRTIPYALQIDKRLTVANNNASYARVFRGYDISDTSKIISQSYSASNVYQNDLITLELVATDNYSNNTGIRAPGKGYTTADLIRNEPLTVVYYDSTGTIILKKIVKVEPTNLITGFNTDTKFVTGIALKSPFVSSVSSSSVQYPCNLSYNTYNFTGVVYYSNGSSAELPIDGNTFRIEGLDGFIPNSANQTFGLTLKYSLRAGESGYGNNTANLLSKAYSLVTTPANASYTVRIHAYPVWVNATTGYVLKWYLSNYKRSTYYDITNYITITSGSFSGINYGANQALGISVNLSNVDATYASVIYTQNITINLANPGTYRQVNSLAANWFVYNDSSLTTPFGSGVFATVYYPSAGTGIFKLNGLFSDYTSWLNAYYTLANPIKDSTGNLMPPTHITVISDTTSITIPIANWNASISLASTLTNNGSLTIVFQNLSVGTNTYIVPIKVPLYQVDSSGNYL